MATPKVAIPSPRIFTSDPVEQIYAKGTLDRDMSGLSFMMKNAATMDREKDQEAYLSGVSEANKMSSMLAQREESNKNMIEVLKQGVEMATKLGSPTSAMPIMQMLRPGGGDDQGAAAKLALLLSEGNKNNAEASKAASEGGPVETSQLQFSPTGVGNEVYTVKGKNGSIVDEMIRRKALQAAKDRGLVSKSGAPMALPSASPTDQQTLNGMTGRYGNVQQ